MAGHFILKSITTSDLSIALGMQADWSPLMHANIGWTGTSTGTLSTALSGQAIGNRDNLPPHRYLILTQEQRDYVEGAGWAENLIRPSGSGMGLKSLDAAAQTAWEAGNKTAAVLRQLERGPVSIEVYYQAGYRMS